ncbi:MAG TPA: hypothetical protein VEJ19_00970 [Nitrososphaerales archaeon]|nr:hypothetical protein [Nitrososphaerales archaeon]
MTARQTSSEGNVVVIERMAVRIVSLLLIVAAVSVFVLWSANAVGSGGETTFALFLAVDLVAVAMISYVERSVSEQGNIGRAPLIAGCCFVLVLVIAGIYLL